MIKITSLLFSATVIVLLSACTGMGAQKELTAEGLFERHVDVAYGGKGMGAQPSVTTNATLSVESFGIEAPIVTKIMEPNYMVFEAEMMGMSMSQGCNTSGCWGQQPGQGVSALNGEQLDFYRQQADTHQYEHIGKYYDTLEIVPSENEAEATTYTVRGVNKHGRENLYYFSKESGLLVGTTITMDSDMGVMTQDTTLKDYQDFGGILYPKETLQSSAMADVMVTINDVSFDPLSEKDFVQPE